MAGHGARGHATWSASATSRNWGCPGALALAETVRNLDKESEAAAWGTACHQISEKCLREECDASTFMGRVEMTREHSFTVDEEMAETAQAYLAYVRGRMAEYAAATGDRAVLSVEQTFSLSKLQPPFEAGGTADAVLWFPAWGLIEVIDLKGGRGVVVEAAGNPQLRTYALGAMLANPGLSVGKVMSTIVQPRAAHKDGRIRSETFHVVDLMEWTADLLAAMRRASDAGNARHKMGGLQWAAQYLNAGSHCKFCPATGVCPALEQKVTDAAGIWFDDLDNPYIANTPDSLDPRRMSRTLDMLDMIEDWIKAVRVLAHTQAETGIDIPGYRLVPRQGRETWRDDAEMTVRTTCIKAGLAEDRFVNPGKLRTPKQVRDALRKVGATDTIRVLEGLSEVPHTGTNLVRADKTTRAAAMPKARQFFTVLD
ncbi:DUF2800 domain-containing protein [Haematospirillum jordaniae]|uniref:DUF2800 domain-containing protein n=1 Tax=Haematospirillum jordaniae TaxID=1549855 RepID=UPI001432A9BB|nr:DUF2800 domain-containing protein [Haematospirillum jordaniae]NKD45367.1 DUF2800 domain-containing protein [Haematospirillum jordaniae]